MEWGSYDDPRARLPVLFLCLGDRLDEKTQEAVHELLIHGELGLALETVADVLARTEPAMSDQDRDDILRVMAGMDINGRIDEILRRFPEIAPLQSETVCPGCGCTATFSIKTTPRVDVRVDFDFDELWDGRFIVWATYQSSEPVREYWVDMGFGWSGGTGAPDYDELIDVNGSTQVHECQRDGGSGDREPRTPLPSPPREATIAGET